MPVHGYVPGVLVQALAIESLVQQRALRQTGWPVSLAGLLPLLGIAMLFIEIEIGALAILTAAVLSGSFAVSVAAQVTMPISLGIGAWITASLCWLLFSVFDRLRTQAVLLFQHRLAIANRRALMHHVVENSFDGIITTDALGHVELFNQAAERMLGMTRGEAAGRRLTEILPQFDLVRPDPDEDAASSVQLQWELTLALKTGGEVVIEILVNRSVLPASQRPHERPSRSSAVYVYSFRDVSVRKNAEAAMQQAMSEALEASRAKSEFIANMSHEFRTPLNAIIGFSDLVRRQDASRINPAKVVEYMGDIHRSGCQLLSLVNDILDLAKIESDALPLEIEPCDVRELLRTPVDTIRPLAEPRNIGIDVEMANLPRAMCDRRAMQQCLINLLSNAAKYSKPSQRINVSVEARDGWLAFQVRDQGTGMAPEIVEKVGQPFLRATSAVVAGIEGTGLGLAITRQLIERQSGAFEIESTLGVGTTVTLFIQAEKHGGAEVGCLANIPFSGKPHEHVLPPPASTETKLRRSA